MRDGWAAALLGEVAYLVMGQSPPGNSYNEDGVGLPFIQGSAEFGEHHPNPVKWCSDPLKVAETGDVLLSVRAPVGDTNVAGQRIAIGRGLALVRGVGGVTTAPFLRLVLEHGTDALLARSGGGMFTSITGAALRGLPVTVPSLEEQRRIVDLIGALDDTVAAALRSEYITRELLSELRRAPQGSDSRPFGELATMRSGPSWKAADEQKTPMSGHEPVLGITNTPAGDTIDLADRRYVAGVPASVQRLDGASLVMIRTNGNRARIGNVYRSTPKVHGFAVSAFQIAIRANELTDAPFLYWYLGSPEVQAAISENASGSTGLGNIAIGWLKQLPIPTLDPAELAAYLERCEAAAGVRQAAGSTLSRLRTLRANLLTALLSGEHEIPESYDELMEVAVG